jgi:tetratricopeptide (TPR) repeat protein/tRNA A-37 threonylcarbamoyl transferase component Bud32
MLDARAAPRAAAPDATVAFPGAADPDEPPGGSTHLDLDAPPRAPGPRVDRTVPFGAETAAFTDRPPKDRGRRKAPKVSVPGYEILGELGRGGMGVVYKARQKSLNRVVALKMVLGGGHAGHDRLARFKAEAEAVAGLQHPNIVQVYEVGEQDGCPYFSLEYVDGENLASRVENMPQPARLAAEWVEALARAIDMTHRKGILHRDLKPANVLLTRDGTPKLTDFGLAKHFGDTESGSTRTGAVLGTPSYMAPEQAAGRIRELGPAADIYALGAILYELLTGRPPFCAESPLDTLKMVQNEEPVAPSRLRPKVPRDLETICLKALDKQPAKRYATAGALADDLRRFLAGEPILARPTPAWERGLKWARRRPALAGLIGVSAAAALALAVGGTVAHIQIRQERDAATEARERAEDNAIRAKRNEVLAKENEAKAEEARKEAERLQKEEKRQRARAETNFKDARDAVDQMLTRVGQERLADEPRMEKVRRDLLERALAFYQRFVRDEGRDPAVRREAGNAYLRVGQIQEQLGRQDRSEEAYREAARVFAALDAESPGNPDYRRGLAAAHNDLGILLQATRRRKDAEQAFGQALALKQQLADAHPEQADYQRDLANGLNNQGNFLQESGRGADAADSHRRALAVLAKLAAAHPGRADYRVEAARTRSNMARVLLGIDRGREAEAALREAADDLAGLVAGGQVPAEARAELAHARLNLAVLLQATGRGPDAEPLYQDARALLGKLADDFPAVVEYREMLADCDRNLGLLLKAAARHREAEPVWRDAVRLLTQLAAERPAEPSYRLKRGWARNELAIALAAANRHADAEAAWREAIPDLEGLAAKQPADPAAWQALADCHANLCALLGSLGRTADEVAARQELLAALEKRAKAFPGVPDHESALGRAWADLAVALAEGNRMADAGRCLREAVRHQRAAAAADPQQAGYAQLLAGHYLALLEVQARLGDHAATSEAARDFARDVPAGRPEYPQAAGWLAQCVPLAAKDEKLPAERRQALVQAYGGQAVELLRQAVRHGYKDLDHVRQAAAFAPLRDRDDFKELVGRP